MVMDPSLFDRPVSPEEWARAQNAGPNQVVQTKLGESPSGQGKGYWPNSDPQKNQTDPITGKTLLSDDPLTEEAIWAMQKYHPFDPTKLGCR